MSGVKGQRSGGRNAKTPQEHKLQGTFQRVRHGGHQGPDVPKGVPQAPNPLNGQAKAEWGRMIARLQAQKTLSLVDDGALYQYCQLFAETEAMAQTQRETAGTIDLLEGTLSRAGEDVVAVVQEISKLRRLEARYMTQIRQGRMALRAYLVEFGLTPASRGRVRIPDASGDRDPFDEFEGTVQ